MLDSVASAGADLLKDASVPTAVAPPVVAHSVPAPQEAAPVVGSQRPSVLDVPVSPESVLSSFPFADSSTRANSRVSSEENERDETIRPSRGWEELIVSEDVGSSGSVDANMDRVSGGIVVPPLPSSSLIGAPPSVLAVSTTVASCSDVVIASNSYSNPPPVPLLSLSIPRPPSVAFSGLLPSSDKPVILPPPSLGHFPRRLIRVSSRSESSSSRNVSKVPEPLGAMSGSRDDGADEFGAMEPDQLFARTLQLVEWIEVALKRRDDVSRDVVHEMSSEAVAGDGRYL